MNLTKLTLVQSDRGYAINETSPTSFVVVYVSREPAVDGNQMVKVLCEARIRGDKLEYSSEALAAEAIRTRILPLYRK